MKLKNLQDILDNPKGKIIAIDLDGTLCEGEFWGDGEPRPKEIIVALVWEWYKKGACIIIYTARQSRFYAETHAWLIKYGVPFHGIAMMMKPGADVYIDDKAINPND